MIDIDNLQGILEFQMESDFKRLRSTCGTSMEDNASSLSFGDAIEIINRLREAEKEAARYRWLRDAPATSASEPIRHWMWSRPYGANMKYLDDAIDQAMKEKGDE